MRLQVDCLQQEGHLEQDEHSVRDLQKKHSEHTLLTSSWDLRPKAARLKTREQKVQDKQQCNLHRGARVNCHFLEFLCPALLGKEGLSLVVAGLLEDTLCDNFFQSSLFCRPPAPLWFPPPPL